MQAVAQDELTTVDKVNFYFAQHVGLVFCGVGIGVLGFGYDKGWMHNTHLCLLCLVLCLIGLFFHEFRPFNVSQAHLHITWGLVRGLPVPTAHVQLVTMSSLTVPCRIAFIAAEAAGTPHELTEPCSAANAGMSVQQCKVPP